MLFIQMLAPHVRRYLIYGHSEVLMWFYVVLPTIEEASSYAPALWLPFAFLSLFPSSSQILSSVTKDKYFTKALFTFRMPYGFMVHESV